MGIYDQLFKEIFSDKEMVLEFINMFIPKLKSYGISAEDITIEHTKFTDIKYGDKESDLLFKVKYFENEVYLYLLIEHQSTVDYLMQFRILEYMVRIWKNYINEHKKESRTKGFKLIPIMPIVFYTGKRKWTAENWFMKKVENWEMFDEYTPKFKYEVIDLSQISEEQLINIKNALGLLLALNKAERNKIQKIIYEIKEELEKLPDKEKEKFRNYVNGVIKTLVKRNGELELPEEVFEEEVENMFENFVKAVNEAIHDALEKGYKEGMEKGKKDGFQQGIQEGIQEGIQQGIQQGILEGERRKAITLLRVQLLKKFGEDIKIYLDKLENMNLDELNNLAENIFDITLDEVIDILKNK
ncbi:hypothetical protein Marpi_0050 [Marinitoga piezophila KA3]|uniref:Transposase (putative) YhgA-like domain-containing protein n=1 Tax=Marinitoga piezophila (strain DSM 14283 / JCM 11233 / KA3) TaxID=443254 RepID=H2J2R5_MARPK|nr:MULTISPECIES: Rpn family recombination-promoting nuclease/putative transposase [Marinitoga]AEX84509.1 hypothetical protein Marpi_0050 [Marinitoga piezophila KA3]APT75003.1 hypothetical protein LN42_00250 [Marinitoga sp. 1137]